MGTRPGHSSSPPPPGEQSVPETWSVRSLIAWAQKYLREHGVEAPRLSAELMLATVLGLDRVQLYLRMDQPLTAGELAGFKALLLRRRAHEPVAYLTGQREFFGLALAVGPGVLIPRPETEHLVEEGLRRLGGLWAPRVLDLCTGSGAVAIAFLAERPRATAVGVDNSREALEFARRNAITHGVEGRSDWLAGDLYAPVAAAGGFFDLITANPPYVTEAEWEALEPQVRDYEPRPALVAGPGGLEVTAQIIAGAGAHLRAGAWLCLELGQGQAREAARLAARAGCFDLVETAPDLAGVERVLCCRRSDYG